MIGSSTDFLAYHLAKQTDIKRIAEVEWDAQLSMVARGVSEEEPPIIRAGLTRRKKTSGNSSHNRV